MSTILAVTECRDGKLHKTSFEVVSQAKKMAESTNSEVVALVIGSGVAEQAASLGEYGAQKVLLADAPQLENYISSHFKSVVLQAVSQTAAEYVLFTATAIGKDLAPRVAVKLNAGMVSDCTAVSMENGNLEVEHPLYAGKVFARLQINTSPKILSLRPGAFEVARINDGATATVENLSVDELDSTVVIKEIKKSSGDKLDVADADIIVTGGRGVRSEADFKIIEDLATTLNAAVGATRAVVDSGWRPHEEQVGQTGKVVSPNLYIMCGASGSIQHWAGMSASKCIVAINKDANAPIFQRADYGIVGDLFEIVPALNEEIKKIKG